MAVSAKEPIDSLLVGKKPTAPAVRQISGGTNTVPTALMIARGGSTASQDAPRSTIRGRTRAVASRNRQASRVREKPKLSTASRKSHKSGA
jgi:hypothetical protein